MQTQLNTTKTQGVNMMAIRSSLIFFSVSQSNLSEDINIENYLDVVQVLKKRGIDFIKYLGKYKGETEYSFCINAKDWLKVEDIVEAFKQESILHVDGNRKAGLMYMKRGNRTNAYEHLGSFCKVSSKEAMESDAYSFNPSNKTFYMVK